MGKSKGLEFTESLVKARSFAAVLEFLGGPFLLAGGNVLSKALCNFFFGNEVHFFESRVFNSLIQANVLVDHLTSL